MKLVLLGTLLCAGALAQAARTVVLFDDAVTVGAGQVRTLALPFDAPPSRIVCSFEVTRGGSGIRAVLLPAADAELWLLGKPHSILASTPFSRRGAFSWKPVLPGHFVLALDHRMEGRSAAKAHLLVRLIYGDASANAASRPAARYKGALLVWSSMVLFAAVAVCSAARIRRNYRRQRESRQAVWL